MIARIVPTKLFIFKDKENTILIREDRLVVCWLVCVCVCVCVFCQETRGYCWRAFTLIF